MLKAKMIPIHGREYSTEFGVRHIVILLYCEVNIPTGTSVCSCKTLILSFFKMLYLVNVKGLKCMLNLDSPF